MQDTAAIIVAGGKGLRFGGPVRKQYLRLRGRTVLWWSLSAFGNSPSICSLTVVVPREDLLRLRAQSRTWRFKKPLILVAGGATRADSVLQGLSAIPDYCRYVAVHDAVRPLVTPRIIEEVTRAARRYKAALAACPSQDTVKLADSRHYVRESPPRETVWLAQTPQIFERRLLERAHAKRQRGSPTDDAQLVERMGVRVKLVESPVDNIKVTTPMDFEIAKNILKGRTGSDAHPHPV